MAEYRLEFSADTSRAGRSISDLQKAIKEVTKEFNNSEIGAESFKKAAGNLSSLKKELSDAQSAVVNLDRAYRNLGRAIESQYQIYGKTLKAGERYHGDILKLAQDQLAEEDRLRNKNYQAELDDWDRRLNAAVAGRNKIIAQERAIMDFRAGMGARGAIPSIASPIRGGIEFPDSPAYKAAMEKAAKGAAKGAGAEVKIQPEKTSLGYFEDRLKNLQKQARLIRPDTPQWEKLNREILNTERNIEKIQKRQKPTNVGSRLGAAGGAFLYGGGLGGGIGSALGGIAGGLAGGVPGAFTGAAIGQVVDTIGQSLAGVTAQAANLQKLQRGLAQASVDAQDFANAQAAIEASSQKLLMPLDQTTKFFTQLRANTREYNLSVQDTQQILEGTALAVMATGGSLEDLDGAMRAVVQIFSKGGVQAEELRGQLGERFPGAVVKFAQANKMSFEELQKALEDGKVGIKDFIEFAKKNYEDYAKFSEQLATAPEYAGQRLQVAFEEMQRTIGEVFGSTGAQIQDTLTYIVKGISNFVKENKSFIQQFVEDWKTILAPIGKVFGDLLKIQGKFILEVGKAFQWLFSQIRQAIGLATIGELKARYDRAAAAIEGKRRPAGQGGERTAAGGELRRQFAEFDAARKAFLGAGGETAYQDSIATGPQNLTFGGKGAGMSLERQGKPEKDKRAKELKEFVNDRIDTLRKRLSYEKAFIDADLDLLDRERVIEKARKDLSYGMQIVDEQVSAAQRQSLEIRVQDRARFLSEMQEQAKIERKTLQSQFAVAVAGNLGRDSEQLTEQYQTLLLSLENARKGIFDMTEVQKQELAIGKELMGLRPDEVAGLQSVINKRLELAGAIDNVNKLLSKESKLSSLEKQLKLAGIIDPRKELRERLRLENPSMEESDIEQLAKLQEQIDKLQGFKEQMISIANTISSAFGEAFKNIVSGSMTAQQAMANFFQSIADSFLDMAAQMIQKWIQMQILGLAQSIFSPMAGIVGGSSIVQGVNVPIAQMPAGMAFANGGIAPGGFIPFKTFATGGAVSGPTLGLVGEGRFNEAVVPLPDGKSIPVELGGNGAGDISTNIVINVNGNGQTQSSMSGTGASDLGRKMEGAVKQVIVNELRPGGLLSRR